jgi:hypothetical protein
MLFRASRRELGNCPETAIWETAVASALGQTEPAGAFLISFQNIVWRLRKIRKPIERLGFELA